MKKITILVVLSAMMIGVLSCSSMKRRDKGAIIGAGAGAVIGGVIGDRAGNTAVGAIIGAAVGGAAGAYIGNYMDKQAEEMERDIEGAKIERVGEGIKITFASGILFDVGKSAVKPAAQTNLQKLSTILNKYEDTEILIEGHTDATGSEDLNMDLSQTQQVLATRMHTNGYGETQPIASNESEEGRQQNRRVDIAIFANDKLKKVAQDQG
jgi:outer membrane protein OmpA-like peptidoglycan-associated protein